MIQDTTNYLYTMWKLGKFYDLGTELSILIEISDRPEWCAILLEKMNFKDSHGFCDELLKIAAEKTLWSKSKFFFESVRKQLLKDQADEINLELFIFEIVAKIIYNASFPKYGFDKDTFSHLPFIVKQHLNACDALDFDVAVRHICFLE